MMRAMREKKDMSQQAVALEIGVERSTVAKWESGKSRPRAELLPKLAKLFGSPLRNCSFRTGRKRRHKKCPAGSGAERRRYGMPREKELYVPTLERIRGRADRIYPDKLLYTQKEAAKIMGCSPDYLRELGIRGLTTCEQLARLFA